MSDGKSRGKKRAVVDPLKHSTAPEHMMNDDEIMTMALKPKRKIYFYILCPVLPTIVQEDILVIHLLEP